MGFYTEKMQPGIEFGRTWVRLMETSLITQKTSSPPHPVRRLQSVAPGKVCRGNPEFSGSFPEYESPQQCAAGRHNWRIAAWKQADADVPVLIEAKREHGKR